MKNIFSVLSVLFFCWNVPQTFSQTISYYATGEEFTGPLPGWKNIKTDFGAKGDGITDDAPAITAAFSAFKDMDNTNSSCGLLFSDILLYSTFILLLFIPQCFDRIFTCCFM